MIYKVLFEQKAPLLDGSEQSLFERSNIHTKPHIDYFSSLQKT